MGRLQCIWSSLLAPPPRGRAALMFAAAAVAVPTLIRMAIDDVVTDVTFAPYFPFICISALMMSSRYAAAVSIASAIVADYLFMTPRYTFFASVGDTVGSLFFLLSAGLIIALA